MAKSIKFDGINRHYMTPPENLAEDGHDTGAPQMWAFSNGILSFTRWQLSPEEIMEVTKTGEIWLAVRCGRRPMQPHWLGSLSFIKRACVDFGGLWRPRHNKPKLLEDKRPRPDEGLEPA